jgi:hypothetical protein
VVAMAGAVKPIVAMAAAVKAPMIVTRTLMSPFPMQSHGIDYTMDSRQPNIPVGEGF